MPVIALVGNDACWSQIAREQVPMFGSSVACKPSVEGALPLVRGVCCWGFPNHITCTLVDGAVRPKIEPCLWKFAKNIPLPEEIWVKMHGFGTYCDRKIIKSLNFWFNSNSAEIGPKIET